MGAVYALLRSCAKTYPEDDSRALKVYQHQVSTMVVRVAHYALGSRRLSSELREQLSRATAPADSAGTFMVAQRVPPSVRP